MMCFQGGPLNSSLYYRKVGHGPDGWVVGMGVEESSFLITTRFIKHKNKSQTRLGLGVQQFQAQGLVWYFVPN